MASVDAIRMTPTTTSNALPGTAPHNPNPQGASALSIGQESANRREIGRAGSTKNMVDTAGTAALTGGDTKYLASDPGASQDIVFGVRTLRRKFPDKSEYRNTFEYLNDTHPQSHNRISTWEPASGTKETIFSKGFYRKQVTGQDESRLQYTMEKAARSDQRAAPRAEHLATQTRHRFLREDGPQGRTGRRHFTLEGHVELAGPDGVEPKPPRLDAPRVVGLLREGVHAPHRDSVRMVFGGLYGYDLGRTAPAAAPAAPRRQISQIFQLD